MKQPRRNPNTTRSKLGLNHVRGVVENTGSIFIKVDQEDDLGVDGFIELIVGGKPAHKSFAVQIKSGPSYYDEKKAECLFPVGAHRQYWVCHPLPVLGIVHVPKLQKAYWFDLKQALRVYPDGATLKVPALRHHEFSEAAFINIFVPFHVTGKTTLPLAELIAYASSLRPAERQFGFHQLFRSYPHERAFWDLLLEHFRQSPADELTPRLPFYLAHVPWHGDLGGDGSSPVEGQMRIDLLREFATFEKSDIVKLLGFINPESGIARGSMGQCVEAVVSAIENFPSKLEAVVEDVDVPIEMRESAASIHAMDQGRKTLPLFDLLIAQGSTYALELRRYVSEVDGFYPYS